MRPDSPAPIALFVYNRPWHTKQTIEALQKNELAAESELFIFSDAAKDSRSEEQVKAVRDYLRTIDGFRNVYITEREENYGLARSIISGVSEVVRLLGKIIVMEDDLVCSKYYLKFMNDALNFYEKKEAVVSISGFMYPVKAALPDYFFLRGAECWGWSTWRRGWDVFEADGRKLMEELRQRRLEREFDMNGAYGYTRMLRNQIEGKNNSWAIRWHASAFLKNMLTLYPGVSLIQNIGMDGSGTHCGNNDYYKAFISDKPFHMDNIPIRENEEVLKEFEKYLKRMKLKGTLNKIGRILRGSKTC